jgi:exopolysaccharide biosynthesis polyprenyl glycosylphosphotransferase
MGRRFLASTIVLDIAALLASVLFATVRVFGFWAPWFVVNPAGSLMTSVVLVFIGAGISLYISYLAWGRSAPRPSYGRAALIVGTTMAITAVGLIITRSYWSREWLLTVTITWLILSVIQRFIRRRRPWTESMVIITNEKQLADDLRMSPHANVIAVVDPLGEPSDVPLVDTGSLVLDLRSVLSDEMAQWVSSASVSGQRVRPLVSVYEEHTGRIPLVHIVGGWEVSRPVQRSTYAPAKRFLDVVLVAITLPLWAILWAMVWLAVKVDSRGPALYHQIRVGRSDEEFTLVKFRTMVNNAEAFGPQFATLNDPRLTRIGNFLRKSRLDEIPQLWNVLMGDLSLVGPRPERPVFVGQYSHTIPFYDSRHLIRPGVTGWAQVNFGYADDDADAIEKLTYDLYYVKYSSIWLDVHILGLSVWTVLSGFGAR